MEELSMEELLNKYCNWEENREKEEADRVFLEERKVKTRVTFDRNDCITISKFVNGYLGVDVDAHNLYHASLKKKLTDGTLIGVSNEFASQNIDYVKKGYILVVLDAKNNPGTYINPVMLDEYFRSLREKTILAKSRSIVKPEDRNKLTEAFLRLNRAVIIINRFKRLINETHTTKKVEKLQLQKELERKAFKIG